MDSSMNMEIGQRNLLRNTNEKSPAYFRTGGTYVPATIQPEPDNQGKSEWRTLIQMIKRLPHTMRESKEKCQPTP